jgi:hypothetical protein
LSGTCGVIGLDGRQFTTADLAGVREALRPLGESEGCWEVMAGGCGVAIGVLGPCKTTPILHRTPRCMASCHLLSSRTPIVGGVVEANSMRDNGVGSSLDPVCSAVEELLERQPPGRVPV